MLHWYASMGRETVILLSLAVILLAGFLLTRLTRLFRLPNVTGYILAGILIGEVAFTMNKAKEGSDGSGTAD